MQVCSGAEGSDFSHKLPLLEELEHELLQRPGASSHCQG